MPRNMVPSCAVEVSVKETVIFGILFSFVIHIDGGAVDFL
jgi:hypothetical protein